jgi:ferrous iron transport protein B
MYLMAGVLIIIGGLILKKIFNYEGISSFIIELPEYRLPSLAPCPPPQMTKQPSLLLSKHRPSSWS